MIISLSFYAFTLMDLDQSPTYSTLLIIAVYLQIINSFIRKNEFIRSY